MAAHRKRRGARLRTPLIGVAAVLTVAAGTTIALARDDVSRGEAVAAADPLAPAHSGQAPEAASRRSRETTLLLSARPEAVTVGSTTTLGVTLVSNETGRPLGGWGIEVWAQRRGANRLLITRLRTDSAGRARLVDRLPRHTTYEFVFPGRGHFRRASSGRVAIPVTPRLGLRRNYAKVPSGYVVTFLGSVSPARPGQVVHLQVQSAKGWRTVGSRPVTPKGTFTIPLRQGRPGRYLYRAYTSSGGTLDPAATDGVQVDVAADTAGTRSPRPPRRVSAAAPLRLLVTGDSLAFYLGEELRADRRARPRMRTELESRHSTGLARPEIFDWHARALAQVAATDPEAVVVWVGGNDCQPLRTPAGRWVPTRSRAWQGEYTRRTTELMQAYAQGGRRVYWVGMPTARAADIDACFRAMTVATRQAALTVPGVTWIDTIAMFSGPNGRYVEDIGGVRVRGEDGIHLTRAGSTILARRLLTLLHADWRVLG